MWYFTHPEQRSVSEDLAAEGTIHSFFAFVEEAATLAPERPIEGPDGAPIEQRHWVFKEGAVRFRLSGIESGRARDSLEAFEALESDEITAPQRARRRDTLTELFGEVPIPVIDLYLSQHNPHLRLMRRALQPATWHLLRVRESDPAQTEMPVFVGEPEPGRPGVELAGGALADMFPIQPWIEDRLRDIFSLRHLPDADLTGEDDGGLAPAQPPDRPPPGPDPALAAEQAEWRPIGLEEQPAYLRHRIDEDGDEPEQVSI